MADNPQIPKLENSLEIRELLYEYFLGSIGYVHINQSITLNWPTPNTLLASSSVATDPVDVRGRYHHAVQVKGINPTTGDTVAIQISLDGTNYVTAQMTPISGAAAVTSIITDGIYSVNSNAWLMQAVITVGVNTGATAITLISRPD